MSLHIDPVQLHSFATAAQVQSTELKRVKLDIYLDSSTLGKFEEATDLVQTINKHTAEVNQRLQATAEALWSLSQAATLAANLAHSSDEHIAKTMKTINHQVDDARRKLGPHAS